MNYELIDNVAIDGVKYTDAPDFADAIIVSADYDGEEMTEAQLDEINDDSEFVHEQVLKYYS